MDFSSALDNLKKGRKVRRKIWPSKQHMIFIKKVDDKEVIWFTPEEKFMNPLVLDSRDIFALDWEVVE